METINESAVPREPWNKGKLIGQKAPLKLKDIWAIRVRLQLGDRVPDDHHAAENSATGAI